ncbi:MAG TPA: YraN family protein [bacterium]|nr:YraN family protein [bacterium]
MKRKNLESTYQKGKSGEDKAAAFLRLKGYKILERNYRVGQGEIDLIAQRGQTLVFVEVKTRRGKSQGSPLEAVTPHKVKRLSNAAAFYLAQHPQVPASCRFDVVTLGPDKNWLGLAKIRHYENAFSVEGGFNI